VHAILQSKLGKPGFVRNESLPCDDTIFTFGLQSRYFCGYHWSCHPAQPVHERLNRAKDILVNRYAFVGLLEEFDLTFR